MYKHDNSPRNCKICHHAHADYMITEPFRTAAAVIGTRDSQAFYEYYIKHVISGEFNRVQ